MKYYIVIIIIILTLLSCNGLYKAGNLEGLMYPVYTRLREETIQNYLDTVIKMHNHSVPDKWLGYDKLVEQDSVNNRLIYFQENPEELYLLSFGGMLILTDVYNPKIRERYWVADRNLVTSSEERRITERLKEQILNKVEELARNDGLPDSVIYVEECR